MGKQKSPHGFINYRVFMILLCAALCVLAAPHRGEAVAPRRASSTIRSRSLRECGCIRWELRR